MARNGRAKFGEAELARQYRVQAFPTVQLLDKNGKNLQKMTGVAPGPDQEISRLKPHLGG